MFTAEGENLSFGGCPTRHQLNVSHGQFTGLNVGLANRTGKGNLRVVHQRFFDLSWVDVVATADDDVLLPPGDPKVAVLVEVTQIAGPKVGLAAELDIETFVPRLIRVGAALDHARPVDADFTDLSGLACLKTVPLTKSS